MSARVVLLILGLAIACDNSPIDRPRNVQGEWVSVTIDPVGQEIASLPDNMATRFRRAFLTELDAGTDTIFFMDTLRLNHSGIATNTSNEFVRGLGGLKAFDEVKHGWEKTLHLPAAHVTSYSRWRVTVDSVTNLAALCLDVLGYGEKECGRIRVFGDTIRIDWGRPIETHREYVRIR